MFVLLAIPFAALCPAAFSQSAPQIVKVTPDESAAEQQVTIDGANFNPSPSYDTVTVGGKTAKIISVGQSSMNVILPADAPSGDQQIVVTCNNQKSAPAKIKILPAPEITTVTLPPEVSPEIQDAASVQSAPPGTQLIVNGRNFGKDQSKIKVYFDDTEAQIVSINGNSIRVVVPDVHSPQFYVQISVAYGPVKSKNSIGIAVQTRVY
jgi:hypothetical protein